MNIIVNTTIRDKYHQGFDRDQPITEIVIHGTGGGANAQGLINWMLNGERAAEYQKGVGLFHYLNDRNGDIYEIIDPARWVYHSSSGIHDKYTIGIEHINPNPKNAAEYTDAQYTALEELILKLLDDYPLINTIVGHVQNTLKYSGPKYVKAPCPGNFNWTRLQTALNAGGLGFSLGLERLSRIL